MLAVAALSARELARVRGRLVEFADEMFASMARKDQRRWGGVLPAWVDAGWQTPVDRADGGEA
jgi:hypothetical protein